MSLYWLPDKKDLVEMIARKLFYRMYRPISNPLATNYRWEDIPFDGCPSSAKFYLEAEWIFNTIYSAAKEVDLDSLFSQYDFIPKCKMKECIFAHYISGCFSCKYFIKPSDFIKRKMK